MFYLNKDTPLTVELLAKMIEKFVLEEKPKLEKYKNYYDGKQASLFRYYADASKPCSKVVVNYAKNIADAYAGYLAAPDFISYRSENDIEDIMDVLRYNDYQDEDAAFLLDALIYGKACELMYIDSDSKTRFKLINPATCFGIYDDSLSGDLLYFVRIYKASEWDNSDLYKLDLYTSNSVIHYQLHGWKGTPQVINEEPHNFSQCPANIFYLADERSIFDCIMTLQDAANELLCSEIDDSSAFCDAYLVLEGAEVDNETKGADGLTDAQRMKQNRLLEIPEGAKAYWLTKNASDAQIENIQKRIHEAIYRIAQCPDFSSESFVGGVSSGIAIRYRLCGMENRAAKIAAEMKKALQRRVEIICGIASLALGEEVYRDIEIDFKRNIPEDLTAIINVINSLKGTVSDATLLGQLPFITDINAELEAVAEQKAANMELYSFAPSFGIEEEE
jgi:SPP1 family phage portal protein